MWGSWGIRVRGEPFTISYVQCEARYLGGARDVLVGARYIV